MKILFIIGTPFSGSTHLGLSLNSITGFSFIGEIDRLPQMKTYIDDPNKDTQMVKECAICSSWGKTCPIFDKIGEDVTEENIHKVIFDLLNDDSVIIDGSKTPEWLRRTSRHLTNNGNQVYAVLLTRHPLGFVESMCRRNALSPMKASAFYRDYYSDAMRTLCDLSPNIPFLFIQYEKFFFNPEYSLMEISNLVNSTRIIKFKEDNNEIHCIGGNLLNYYAHSEYNPQSVPSNLELHEKERLEKKPKTDGVLQWQNRISSKQIRDFLMTPGACDIGSLLGYRYDL